MFIAEEPAPIDGGSLCKIARSDRPWLRCLWRYISSEEWPTALSTQTNRGILTDLSLPMLFHGRDHSQEAIVENMDDAETKHVIGTVLFLAVHCVLL
jgi:hypothetical protein